MVTYTIDGNERLIRTQCGGQVTLEEVAAHFRDLARDPACPNRLDVLLDLRYVESLPDRGELEAVTVELSRLRAKVRFGLCAVVAERSALFGMLRVFEVLAQDSFTALRVFRDFAEAETWLVAQRPPVREM
jgi:hypothetical protein